MSKYILDGTKIQYYKKRLKAWKRGEWISPITVDIALTRACNYRCQYCYGVLQENMGKGIIDRYKALEFLDDCKELGVRGVSLVSDGESTCHPDYLEIIKHGSDLGLAMALGTHGTNIGITDIPRLIPYLSYLRFNISAGIADRYSEIHGVTRDKFHIAIRNILTAVMVSRRHYQLTGWECTIGMQMVLRPEYADQIEPLVSLAKTLGVHYLQIKHCSDDEQGRLGVDYGKYKGLEERLKEAESRTDSYTRIAVKWSKILEGSSRAYQYCYGPPFILQVSGTGLVAPCGMLFNDRYKRYHLGNINETRFQEIVRSARYKEVMQELRGEGEKPFDARTMCGCLCLQHDVNKYLDKVIKGEINLLEGGDTEIPNHMEFI